MGRTVVETRREVVLAPGPLPDFLSRKFQKNIAEGALESDTDVNVSSATYELGTPGLF